MENRGALYLGLLLIVAGIYFLAANFVAPALGLGWGQLWPGFLGLAGLAFYLPIVVWWERRRSLAGLAVPGTILMVNALIFFYNTLTGDWNAWAYLWALEPVAVGLGLLLIWVIGPHDPGLLVAAAIVGGIGLVLFMIFGSAFGSPVARIVAPIVLIGFGLLFLVRAVVKRS
jgi:hypothetical protein